MVITGTLKDGNVSKDLSLAARSSATVVILMGVSKLPEIIRFFKKERGNRESIALIQNGSLPHEKMLIGNLGDILEKQTKVRIEAPAIIIIGQVVAEKLQSNPELKDAISQF